VRFHRTDGARPRGSGRRHRERRAAVAVLHAAEPVPGTISACIALAKVREKETGKAPILDSDFATDVEEVLSHRRPWSQAQGRMFPLRAWQDQASRLYSPAND
jgi:hypothetical protein